MERKTALLVVAGAVTFLVVLFITLLVTARTEISPAPSPASTCNTIQYRGPEAFNVLFIASKEEATRYTSYFFAEEPYNKHKEEFNVFYLDTVNPAQVCTRYKELASLCYSDALLKAAAACPHNVIIVLVDEPTKIRSSAYKNVLSLNRNHPPQEVLRHELGHLYGLAEEYTPASLPAGQRNCQATCAPFETATSECFAGCSKDSLYRSINAGVMRTLEKSEYGPYDESLIEQKMEALRSASGGMTTGNVIEAAPSCADQSFYLIEVDTSQETWDVQAQEKVTGCPSGTSGTEYGAELRDAAGNVRATTGQRDNTLFTDAPGEGDIDGETYERSSFWVELPAESETSSFHVRDETGRERGSASLPLGGAILCRRL